MFKNLKKNKKGFTLIEIIVVVVILAVLMAVAVPSVLKYIHEADDAKYMAQARAGMIAAQTEIAKAYVDNDTTTTTTSACNAAATEVNKSTEETSELHIKSITVYTDAAATENNKLADTGDPATIKSYKIEFASKNAIITPNGIVELKDSDK